VAAECEFVELDDPRLDPYRDLRHATHTRWSGIFVVEGRLLVTRLAASRYPMQSVVVSERYVNQLPPQLPSGVPIFVLAHRSIDQLIGFHFHRGMLACAQRLPDPSLMQLRAAASPTSLWCVCPRILDPTNLGSILRNAAAFGATAVVLGPQSADPLSRRTLRVSMGAALTVPIVRARDVGAALCQLRDEGGVELMAAVLARPAVELTAVQRPPHVGLLFGSEGDGLDAQLEQLCALRITLSMDWQTDSLNVASASAVFLYHLARIAPLR
jgi:tRNA G18 (ribose-2'-O)-methylase SpoU